MQKLLEEKTKFKENMCQHISIIKLGYLLKMLKLMYPDRASMIGAEAYLDKIRKIKNQTKRKHYKLKNQTFDSLVHSSNNNLRKGADPLEHIQNKSVKIVQSFVDQFMSQIQISRQDAVK